MEISERRQANILVLRPVGRVDNLTSAEFQARLVAAVTFAAADIVVDFILSVYRVLPDADGLIFDAMYSLADTISVKEDWGHSSNVVAVELAQAARVKRLVLFHHEPAYDDHMIEEVFTDTLRFEEISRPGHKVEVISAYDGLELEL